ncbi:Retrovirus-related Pol polyprotein from transposon TNT 1-94 [Senna tora]|uniref:Retrovirus-related Pol polyprotein from transposon TNT 1-94 n=1 Tax=Senna tora TaxID=362788 RepID=A0A834VYB9_9FABA|nr:Retrovirus-related Pol polyprotein from transposon TNT 1-94 [Senna tora]
MEEAGSFTAIVASFFHVREHAYLIGSVVFEQEHMQCILEGLLEEYESFVTSAHMKSDMETVKELEALFISQEIRVEQNTMAAKTNYSPSANVVVTDGKDKNSSNKNTYSSNQSAARSYNNNYRGGRNGPGGGRSRGRGHGN